MVQTQQPTKQDHSVIRQLLSAGARVPPIAVFKALPKTDLCSSKTDNVKNNNVDLKHTVNKNIPIDAFQSEDRDITDFNDIDLSSSSELFPEIGLPLPDLHDIDDMVTNETSPSPDYSKSILNSVQIPTTPECVESIMSCSFPRSDQALFSLFGRGDNVTSPGIVTPPRNQQFEVQDRRSPTQICSSSDSEAASSPPPALCTIPSPTETTGSTIKSLLNRPPMNTSVPSSFTFNAGTPAQSTPPTQTTCDTSTPEISSAPIIPTVVQASPAIPLSVLAMGDDETAAEAQRKLKELEGENAATSSSAVSSNEEEESEEEPVKPVRRRWVKKVSSVAGPKAKRERKASSVSSDQDFDMDMDDLDSEYGEDGERLERRRHNNRVAAQRCRQRKREYHLSLTKEIQQWECSNTALKYDIHTLQKELQELQQVLQQHQAECTVDPAELAAAGSIKKSKKKSKKRSKSHKHKR